jgi:hypothetical protein
MKSKSYLSLFCLVSIFISCETETKIVFEETEITTQNNSVVSINIPKASGTINIAKNINEGISNAITDILNFGELDAATISIEELIINFNDEFNTFKNNFPDSVQEWEIQIDGDIMYQSSEIISIALTSYVDTGGAHGVLTITFLNFDTETGLLISNAKLFTDNKAINDMTKSYFVKIINEKEISVFDDDEFQLPENIGYSEDGILILYNVYEVASYADGIIQFTIPFNEISSSLKYH